MTPMMHRKPRSARVLSPVHRSDFRLPCVRSASLRVPGLLFVLALAASGAFGQRLLNVVPTGDDPAPDGWSASVDHDLVRSAPGRLEIAAPDGRVLSPEMSVFEDRGDGNAMWAGGYPEQGYDSVLLTLQDGYLVGRLGLPEGGTYWLRSERGNGRLTEGLATGRSCGGGLVPDVDSRMRSVEAASADHPRRVVEAATEDGLDILMLWTPSAAQRLEQAGWGTPATAMQHAMDYLNLVFRNNQMGVTAHMVHQQEAPEALHEIEDPLGPLTTNDDVEDLRVEHEADLVHLFFNEAPGFCGQAWLMTLGDTAESFWRLGHGVTTVAGGCISAERLVRDGEHGAHVETFAHEVGHNLGANHDPGSTSVNNGGDSTRPVYPYAFGHHNFTPLPNVKSVMSYNEGRQEPFFSTVRLKPSGYSIGLAGERENERALQQTLPVAVRFSDFLPDPSGPTNPGEDLPAAPTDLTAFATGDRSVRVTWRDESDNEDGFEVHARLRNRDWETVASVAADATSADVDGLASGGRYDFRVRAWNEDGGRESHLATIVLRQGTYSDCVPSTALVTFEGGYTVGMCIEYRDSATGETVKRDALDFDLESSDSALLYFFDRDNAEVLVKLLDPCALPAYDHRWVFVAPVTTLAFNLRIEEIVTGRTWTHSNPRGGQTAMTDSDLRAFPCSPAGSSSGGEDGSAGVELVAAGSQPPPAAVSAPAPAVPGLPAVTTEAVNAAGEAECTPAPVVTLRGGYTVKMCVENRNSEGETEVFAVRDYGLDSDQSAILYFFDRNNAEVLIKLLDPCALPAYDHRWVFVAPVTTLAYNLEIEAPTGEVWRQENVLNRTASTAADLRAFACGS